MDSRRVGRSVELLLDLKLLLLLNLLLLLLLLLLDSGELLEQRPLTLGHRRHPLGRMRPSL